MRINDWGNYVADTDEIIEALLDGVHAPEAEKCLNNYEPLFRSYIEKCIETEPAEYEFMETSDGFFSVSQSLWSFADGLVDAILADALDYIADADPTEEPWTLGEALAEVLNA